MLTRMKMGNLMKYATIHKQHDRVAVSPSSNTNSIYTTVLESQVIIRRDLCMIPRHVYIKAYDPCLSGENVPILHNMVSINC